MRWMAALLGLMIVPAGLAETKAAAGTAVSAASAGSPLDFVMSNIDGQPVELNKYRGRVVLIVNVASKCGYTKQYAGLEELHQKYREQGLSILAFPANNFMGQEPGSNAEIKQFCTSEYKTSFDLFAKISVKGDDQAELYKYLTSKDKVGEAGGEIPWNFTKFLVGRDGKVIERYGPRTKPQDDELIKALEAALRADSGEKKKAAEAPRP